LNQKSHSLFANDLFDGDPGECAIRSQSLDPGRWAPTNAPTVIRTRYYRLILKQGIGLTREGVINTPIQQSQHLCVGANQKPLVFNQKNLF
jgi:hypothetical protein